MVLPLRSKNTNAAAPVQQQHPPKKQHEEEEPQHGGGDYGVSFDPASMEGGMTRPRQQGSIPLTPHPTKKQRLNIGMAEYGHNNDDMQQHAYGATQEDIHHDKENDDSVETERHHNGGNNDQDDSALEESGNVDDDDNAPPPEEEEEPEWEELMQHEPARTDIPIFLAARERKYEAEKRFAAALDECHAAIQRSQEMLLEIAIEYYQAQQDRMNMLEADIKQNLICNHESRVMMQHRLNESAKEAQGLFAQLMMRVSQPLSRAVQNLQNNIPSNNNEYGEETAENPAQDEE